MSDAPEDLSVYWPLLPEQYDDANAAIDFLYNSILEAREAGFGPGMDEALGSLADRYGTVEDATGHLAVGMTLVATHLVAMRQKGLGKSPQQTVEALRRAFVRPSDDGE